MSTQAVATTRKTARYVQRWLVQPPLRVVRALEQRSQRAVASMEGSLAERIQAHEAAGTDAAAACTRQHLREQGQLLHYRVVRCGSELRHLLSGAYFRDYGMAKLLLDVRCATRLLFIFLVAVLVGRRHVYPPVAPDSPFVVALQQKTNPNY